MSLLKVIELIRDMCGLPHESIKPHSMDDDYIRDELAMAAVSYITPESERIYMTTNKAPVTWPWSDELWKPTPEDRAEELNKAAMLLIAEIQRQIRRRE